MVVVFVDDRGEGHSFFRGRVVVGVDLENGGGGSVPVVVVVFSKIFIYLELFLNQIVLQLLSIFNNFISSMYGMYGILVPNCGWSLCCCPRWPKGVVTRI